MGRVRSCRPAVAVGVLAAATVCMLALGSLGVTIAAVLSSSAAVAGLLVAVLEAREKSVSDDRLRAVAQQLARDVHDQETAVLARLTADRADVKLADVSFAQPEQAQIHWRIDGGDQQGTLSEVEGYYRSLGRGRLVVQGEPGAGKTVLAIQLVRDLAQAVLRIDGLHPLPRVPVRLSLPSFNPGDDSDKVTDEVVSDRLDRWLVQHLKTVFGLRAEVAATLMEGGWILPVLDGLDEMDPDDAEPRRAAAVIRALNYPSAGCVRSVVVTCRTSRYQQLSERLESAGKAPSAKQQAASPAGRCEVVEDATVVSVQPLTAESAVSYLTHRFHNSKDQAQWYPIFKRLTDSNGGGEPLVAALGSPLRLFLIVTAYRHDTSTLDQLTELATVADIDEYLFPRLVPAVLEQHRPAGRQYAAPEVTRWLTTLAHHLASQGKRGGSPSDLRLDLLWPAAGWRAPRYAATAATTTVACALLVFGFCVLARWPPDMLSVFGLATFVVVAACIALQPAVDLRRLDLSDFRTSVGRQRIGWFLAGGFVIGLMGGFIVALVSSVVEPAGRLMVTLEFSVIGLVGGLMVALSSGTATRPTVIDRPARLVQQGVVHTLAAMVAFSLVLVIVGEVGTGLAAGVVGELVAGLAALLAFRLVIGPMGGLAVGLAVGLNSHNNHSGALPFAVVALVVGLIFAAKSPWPRYLFAVLFLAYQRDLPRRPAVFMNWAYQAGLMRLSGIAVQFRHREFQTWLVTHDQQGDGPQPRFLTTRTGGGMT
jgi:NACHT domain